MFVIIEVQSLIKFQYRAIHTTVATALEIQEQANKTVHITANYRTHIFYPC